MPEEPVKEIHKATSLLQLRTQNELEPKWKALEFNKQIKGAKTLYSSAKAAMKESEPDEELVYIYLYRAMMIWQNICKSSDYAADKKYYQLMYGKEMQDIIELLEIYSDKLQKRYTDMQNRQTETESGQCLQSQFTLATIVVPKKRKEGKDSNKSEVSNGTKNPTGADQYCLDDYHTLIMNPNFSQSKTDHYGEKKFIECDVLKERLIGSILDLLIIDTRPKSDYELSKIQSAHSVNIPGSSILPGLSANKLGELITVEKEKGYWSQRDVYDQVVLLDWHSEEKDVVPASPLSNLYVSLTKWDPDCIYKNKPMILNGGFERFLDMYPTFTTNPKIICPEKPKSNQFINFSDHDIEYPMNILEEDKPEPVSKTVSKVVKETDLTTPISRPLIDRTTKPQMVLGRMDKSDHTLVPSNENPMETIVSNTVNSRTFTQGESMEEEKVVPPKILQNGESVSQIAQIKDVTSEKRTTPQGPSSISPRPVTPPRSEKHKALTSKGNTVSGDGDSDIHLERTKFETPSRSGGLKRSASSPNINKLGEEDLDTSTWMSPIFDRSTKPKPSYDYIPRSAGTDTVYLAGSNKKGRGLTGLKNLGNLCYMNSIMQCISHTEELMKELTRFNTKDKEYRPGSARVASEVSSLLRILWQGDTRITSCRGLKMKVGSLRHSFSTMEQQDSHEFLTILVDWLHEDLNEPSPIRSLDGADVATGEKAWGEFRQKNNSVVVDLFYGQLKSTVTCDYCQATSVLFEPFSNLSIPLPSSQDDKDRTFTLQECLKLYLKGESISGWVCPNCKTARKATKKLDITRLPPVLIIHLKRFMNDMVGVGWCRKRMNMVDFPISDLEMKPFTHPESELRIHNYNLYAVSNHYGSMESGHYTAYCRNHALNKWYKFDDQDVNEISPSEVKSSAAYILFYESCHLDSQSQRILD